MVCKICGKDLTIPDPELLSATAEWKEKMKDMTCEEIHLEYVSATMSYIHFAAEELLIERGHSELFEQKPECHGSHGSDNRWDEIWERESFREVYDVETAELKPFLTVDREWLDEVKTWGDAINHQLETVKEILKDEDHE